MELLQSFLALCCTVVVLIYGWKIMNLVWFRPRKMEKILRQQGFGGKSYRFLIGDLNEMKNMGEEALSKPIDFSDDFVPRTISFIHKTVTNHGENSFVWLGPYAAVIISDPENVREVLSKSYVFQKPYNPLGKLVAQGLASYETDKWAKHRRLINPAFHLDKVKHMLPSFHKSCAEMLSKWEKIVPSEGCFELDVWPYLQTMTSDAISLTAFGSSYEQGIKIFELQKEQAALLIKAILSAFIPGWRFLPTKTNRRMKHIITEVESLLLAIIDKRTKAIEAGEATSNDLLDILLESNSKEIKQNGHKFGMSLQDVIEECKLFYLAGQETTSSLLVWTMILLSKHLDWQARAREEVLHVFRSGTPDFQDLSRLKIVSMIFQEVLRLYPPGLLISRAVHKETALGNIVLPAGVQLLLPVILLHHDCKIWGEDAKDFNPERFSEGVSEATGGSLSYFPFGWGPRICIGQNFAMLEAKMALAMILQHYSFELSPSYSHAPHTVLTLQPQHGAHLILRKLPV
ncbi:hypothetical protein ABFS82_13G039800 [Erythranthe guttata]|uniref:Cytochrome P450 n=1 Tax=Erythranthe guttata TaxID=4155 RepID=A0A022QYJ5_ERYGU|nr:PREDICTED: cytochrome P450 CYP72A219-like [Erythranthe guttata]EYU31635.1 hypothetical protein MIMGU_mgv1a025572mg [Erythranthe guttata]|eukprot:XP_012844327.1 PREDICTED: cytochrome P450 CYP72A219-like [Erythranthe guttata]